LFKSEPKEDELPPEEQEVEIVLASEVAAPELVAAAPLPPEPKPPDVEIPSPTVQGIRFVRTDPNAPSDAPPPPPGTAPFISNRNTRAASEEPPDPNGDPNMPNQKGEDVPVIDTMHRDFAPGEIVDAARAATAHRPPPSAAPAPSTGPLVAAPSPAAAPATPPPVGEASKTPAPATAEEKPKEKGVSIDDPDAENVATERESADKDATRPPAPREPDMAKLRPREPSPPAAPAQTPREPAASDVASSGSPGAPEAKDAKALQQLTRKNLLRGSISTKGKSAVTQRFHPACAINRDKVSYGVVQVEFDVNKNGKPENLRIAKGTQASAVLQDLVLGVVLDSKIPPIPVNIDDYLIGGRLHISYGFVFH
jgi:outer membrane biosynthesis protein TonB